MVLAFREDWSLGPSSPAPDFAVDICSPQAVLNPCHTIAQQTNPFTNHPEAARPVKAQLQKAGCWAAGIQQTQVWRCCTLADNPETERYAFTQMFTPPHSSHLPRSSSTSSSSPGFSHPRSHSSGVFCTDFLSLQRLKLFSDLSSYFFHLTPSPPSSLTGTLAVDVPSWTTTLPAASTASPACGSRVNIFLPCMSQSHCIIWSSSPLCRAWGTPLAALQTFTPPSQLPMEMDLLLDSWIFSHGSSSWPWHVFVKHCFSPNPTSWCSSATSTPYLTAAPQPLWSCSPLTSSLPTPLGQGSELYLPSAKSIRPWEALPSQRVVVSITLP